MSDEEIRLECVRLAIDFAHYRVQAGTNYALDRNLILSTAEEFYGFVSNKDE